MNWHLLLEQLIRKISIFSFDRDIFSEIYFLPSSVTDRPDPGDQNLNILEQDVDNENREDKDSNPNDEKDIEVNLNSSQHGIVKNIATANRQSCASDKDIDNNFNIDSPIASTSFQQNQLSFISSKEFQPALRAAARKNARKKRKAGTSLIATDTLEKNLLEMEQEDKKRTVPKKTKRVLMESFSTN